jgi:hypothetical protein
MPATCWAAPSPAQAFLDFRSVALHPAIQRGVIQINATLFHHLFQIAIADAVFAIPPHRAQDNLAHKMPPFEITAHPVCLSPEIDLLTDSIITFHISFFATAPVQVYCK